MSSKLKESNSFSSCNTLPHLHWALCGVSSHCHCDSVFVRSTNISENQCLIEGYDSHLSSPLKLKRPRIWPNKPQTDLWVPSGSFLVIVLGSFPLWDSSVRCYWKSVREGHSLPVIFHVGGPLHWEISGMDFLL